MTSAAATATARRATDDRDHAHAWSRMRFELVDDHPVVRQECESCGLVRRYRAWERSWVPGEAEVRR